MNSPPQHRLHAIRQVLVGLPEFNGALVRLDIAQGLHVFYGMNGVGKSKLLSSIPDGLFEIEAGLDPHSANELWNIWPDSWSFGHEDDLHFGVPQIHPTDHEWAVPELDFIYEYTQQIRESEGSNKDDVFGFATKGWQQLEQWTLRLAFWVGEVHRIEDEEGKRIVVEAIREILFLGILRVRRTPPQRYLGGDPWGYGATRTEGWDVGICAPLGPEYPATWRYINYASDKLLGIPDHLMGDDDETQDQLDQLFIENLDSAPVALLRELFIDTSGDVQGILDRGGLPTARSSLRQYDLVCSRNITSDPIAFLGEKSITELNLWQAYIYPTVSEEHRQGVRSYGEPGFLRSDRQLEELLLGTDDSPAVHPDLHLFCKQFSTRANIFFQKLLVSAPRLRVRMSDPGEWRHQDLVVCELLDTSGRWIPVANASDTQCRLATIAIQLAQFDPDSQAIPILIIDEPERGLHRLAELHLRAGLIALEREIPGLIICVATHSPLFLRPDLASLHHVQRTNDGGVSVNKLASANLNNAKGLGISTTDLLQLTRTIVLVEGAHDEWVLNTLFAEEFEELGVRILSIRGATKLHSAAEGKLLFDYTEANILVMLDNVSTEKCEVAWNNAIDAWNEQQGIPGVVQALEKMFPRKHSTESKAIVEFCRAAIEHGRRDRISFQMLRKGDIEFYFDPSFFLDAKEFPEGFPSWATLRREHKKASGPFKSWLQEDGRAKFNRTNFSRAAKSAKKSGNVPSDLLAVLDAIQRLHELHPR